MKPTIDAPWLAELTPEHPPAPAGWWPPAPGWWALAVLVLLSIAAAWSWWRNPQRKLRRIALEELARIRATDANAAATARAIQNLLRRYTLASFGPERVARLSGGAWLGFLAAGGAAALGGPLGQSLLAASYGGQPAADRAGDREQWLIAAEKFLRRAARRRPWRAR